MRIYPETTSQLTEIVTELVAKGITFTAHPIPGCSGLWVIELTGGY